MNRHETGLDMDQHFVLWAWLRSPEEWPKPLRAKIDALRHAHDTVEDMTVEGDAFGDAWLEDAWWEPLVTRDDAVLAALRALHPETSAPTFSAIRAADMALDGAIAAYRERIASAKGGVQ